MQDTRRGNRVSKYTGVLRYCPASLTNRFGDTEQSPCKINRRREGLWLHLTIFTVFHTVNIQTVPFGVRGGMIGNRVVLTMATPRSVPECVTHTVDFKTTTMQFKSVKMNHRMWRKQRGMHWFLVGKLQGSQPAGGQQLL